jgi:hypothetical protein
VRGGRYSGPGLHAKHLLTGVSRESAASTPRPPVAGRCAYCSTLIKPGQVTAKSRRGRVYHLACLFKSQAKSANTQAEREAARAEREERADAAAEDSMRGYKPSSWRLGKSPADYGRRSR